MSLFFFLLLLLPLSSISVPNNELSTLMAIKHSLDPQDQILTSWTSNSDPCSDSFVGVACNQEGKVVNISLQGKGLSGKLPAAVGEFKSLTGLYLHFNSLSGEIPKEIAGLSELIDLYLNVNDLSGNIPSQMGNMSNLQVLLLCYNKLSGGIPNQIGNMKKLSVLSMQYNQLTGAIPASFSRLEMLTRLDLSFNNLFGPIPEKLADASMLQVLDLQNNSLVGNVPPALKRLTSGFQYKNNLGLCGIGFSDLSLCTASKNYNPNRPEPYQPILPSNLSTKSIPESADLLPSNCSESICNNNHKKLSKSPQIMVIFSVIGIIFACLITVFSLVSWYNRKKQKIGSSLETSDGHVIISTNQVMKEGVVHRRSVSSLISLEYSNGWDPLSKNQSGTGFSRELFENFMFNLEEVDRATQCFSVSNLLSRSNNFSSVYRGLLRDRSIVAIKCIAKTSCQSDESEFLNGLKILTSLKHDNLVRLRGFCCSKGRGECFLIYDFVPNRSLLQYLDGTTRPVLDWSTRVSVITGIAKGIGYLHGEGIVHQNISAEKILIGEANSPILLDSGEHKLLADDTIFSMVKASAAKGYLCPEYTTTGRFTEKSDVYAFGMIILQVITGKRDVTFFDGKLEDFIDPNINGKFPELEANKLKRIAILCINGSAEQRPFMKDVIRELDA